MPGNDRSVKLTVAASMDGFVRELDRGAAASQSFEKRAVASAKAVAKGLHEQEQAASTVAKPLLAIGAAATLGFGFAVKSAADFDQRMSSVKSLSHATAGEMGQLRDVALNAGTAIGYSATQAADAEIELVKAGVQVADITGGALSGSLKLAAAGQIDVAEATSIAASTMTQFGKTGADVTHIADLLAAGADKALGGVEDLGQGLKYLGPIAAANNISLEQTVGTMSLLAQNAILGEQAGTSLRGVLSSLTSPSKVAAETMDQYGISVYDAQGKFVGFNGVAEELHTKLFRLGDAERNAALGRIFGNEQITAATILMKSGASEVDKWTKAVDEQGFATEQAVGKMDNLNGDVTKLKASFQTAAIVTGEAAQGPFREVVQSFTDMVQAYNQGPEAMQAATLGVLGLTAAVTLGGGAFLIGVPKVVAFGLALQTLSNSQIPGVSRAAGIGLKAASGFGRGVGAVAGLLTGPFGFALAGAALAVKSFDLAASSGSASQKELASAIEHTTGAANLLKLAGQRSDLSKFLVGDVGDELKDIPALMDKATDASSTFWSFLSIDAAASSQKTTQALKSLREVGAQLGTVAAADAPAAARAFSELAEAQSLTDAEASKLLSGPFKDYRSELMNQANALGIATTQSNLLLLATGEYDEAASKAKNPTKENAAALGDLKAAGEDAAKAIEDTANALKNLTSPTLDAREAKRQLAAAVDAVTSSVKENGKSLDINSEKGRANQSALDGIAQAALNAGGAIYKQTGDQQAATAAIDAGRESLIAALGQYGITGQAAEDYADKIIGTPKDWATTFSNNSTAEGQKVDQYTGKVKATPSEKVTKMQAEIRQAEQNLADLQAKLGSVPKSKSTELRAEVAAAKQRLAELQAALNGIQSKTITVTTNQVTVATASNTNGVFKNPDRKALGGAIYGPGTGTSDQVPILASNGEHMITAAEVLAAGGHQAVYAWRKSLLAGARGYAGGGEITPPRYSPAGPTVIVQTAPTGRSGALVENLTLRVGDQATGQSAIDQLMFQLRVLDNGGR